MTNDRCGAARALILAGVALALLAVAVPGLRDRGLRIFERDASRREELQRRVRAERLRAIDPSLAEAGVTIDTTGADDGAGGTGTGAPSFTASVRRWWRGVTGAPPEPLAPVPLRDSLGLLPGERMALPDGRIVEYDTTTMRMRPPR